MSNLHLNLDEANKHTPKGFDNAATNTRPWKDESNQSTYTENETLPRALNFVDGTTAPPTTTNGHIYVITGTGTVNSGWGSAAFNDWVRFANGFPVSISPVTGYLCYDVTASQWMEFDGTTWVAFGGGGAGVTNLTIGNKTSSSLDVQSSTGTDATVPSFNATEAGLAPASSGGIIKFLRADGTWVDIFQTIRMQGLTTYLATGSTEAEALKLKQELLSGIGRLTWTGTTGSLFSIIDDKDNELWTASDISGNPVGYIDADWHVRFGNPFNRPFSIRHDSTTGIDYTKFVLPDYANDAAADADTALLSGESYTTSAVDRTIKIKP